MRSTQYEEPVVDEHRPQLKTIPNLPALPCPECSGELRLRRSRHGLFYGCINFPQCDCKHGAHQETGLPLGVPANAATRNARVYAHAAFDPLWKSGAMKRVEAYRWLARKMNRVEVHIGEMSSEECQQVIEICTERVRPYSGQGKMRRA